MSDLTIEELCIPKKCKDDLVSRREVYKFLLACKTGWDFSQALMNMPSAEPEQKTGKWIEKKNIMLGDYIECSLCGNKESRWNMKNYCPNCGAKMEEQK